MKKISFFLLFIAFFLFISLNSCSKPTPQGKCECPQQKDGGTEKEQKNPDKKQAEGEKKVQRCTAATEHFYEDPRGDLASFSRGDLLRCEELGSRSQASLDGDSLFKVSGGKAENGIKIYRIAYITQGKKAQPRLTTALVYAPIDAKGAFLKPKAVVVVNHGTTGVAKFCAPSHAPQASVEYMILPLVGRGYLVVAPDYIGLGIGAPEGHPYLITEPSANAALDSLKALEMFAQLPAHKLSLTKKAFLTGHSQGGQVAIAAAEAFTKLAKNWELLGAIAYAPAFGDARLWMVPIPAQYKTSRATAYFVMYLSALERYYAQPPYGTFLNPKNRKKIQGLLAGFCYSELTKMLISTLPTYEEIFSSDFLTASQRCQGGKGDCSTYKRWLDHYKASEIGHGKIPAPILLVQGEKDYNVPTYTVECLAKRIIANGSPVQRCLVPMANHLTVVSSSWTKTLEWIEAVRKKQLSSFKPCLKATFPPCP